MSYIIVKKKFLSDSMEILFRNDKLHLIEAQYLDYRATCIRNADFEFLVFKDLKAVRITEVVETHTMSIQK